MNRTLPTSLFRPYTMLFFFFFNDTATTEIYTLSLHDALPILSGARIPKWIAYYVEHNLHATITESAITLLQEAAGTELTQLKVELDKLVSRSEEHTSELQSLTNLVCRLLLENRKTHV